MGEAYDMYPKERRLYNAYILLNDGFDRPFLCIDYLHRYIDSVQSYNDKAKCRIFLSVSCLHQIFQSFLTLFPIKRCSLSMHCQNVCTLRLQDSSMHFPHLLRKRQFLPQLFFCCLLRLIQTQGTISWFVHRICVYLSSEKRLLQRIFFDFHSMI